MRVCFFFCKKQTNDQLLPCFHCHEILVHDRRLQSSRWQPITYAGGRGCVDSYLVALFSPSSCPIPLWWIHEIINIFLMIVVSHSAEVRTDQIVTSEMKMQEVSSCHLTECPCRMGSSEKCQIVNAKISHEHARTPPMIVENINVAIKHIGYI